MNPFKREPGYLREDSFIGGLYLCGIVLICWVIYQIYLFINNNIEIIMITLLVLVIIGIAISGIKKIPIGHKGLKITLGKRTNEIFDEGYSWHIPFIDKIEIVDCRERFTENQTMRLNLNNMIPATVVVSAYYKISNLYNYFENYSISDLHKKVNTDIYRNIREFLSEEDVDEKQLLRIKNIEYRNSQLNEINSDYLHNLGLRITNIVIESIHLDQDMQSFYNTIHQADLLAMNKNLNYSDALKTVGSSLGLR
jgi:regulator of protease activity HflC (stomatin/prohibitin superfamily)